MWTCPLCPLCLNLIITPAVTHHNNNNEYRAFSPCCIQCSTSTNTHILCNSLCSKRCSRLCRRLCRRVCNSPCSTLRITFHISNRVSTALLPGLGFLPDISFHSDSLYLSLSRSLRTFGMLPAWKDASFSYQYPLGNPPISTSTTPR
jgi:hypothetical protein